jgi:hypothetical protein
MHARFVSVCAGLCLAPVASAQLVTAITQPLFGLNPPEVFLTDVGQGTSSFLFDPLVIPATAPGFGGLAADEPNQRLFGTVRNGPQNDLYTLDYATLTPTLVGQIRVDGTAIAVDGLAYDSDDGVLYATRRLGTGDVPEGLFQVDATTGDATLLVQYEVGTFDFEISAIDYDPATQLVYLVDEDTGGGAGIYTFSSSFPGSIDFFAPLPAGVTDVDGLAAGNGVLYLISDSDPDGNGGLHRAFNTQSLQVVDTIQSPHPPYTTGTPFGTINVSGSAAFAPGLAQQPCFADLVFPFGITDLSDVDAFIAFFAVGDPAVDFVEPFGFVDLSDLDAFIASFLAGCP